MAATQKSTTKKASGPRSIHPLLAALQHVLLWFFIGASSISIAAVVSSLMGVTVSADALASLIAVTIITFIPYAVFYILYLGKVRREPRTIPSTVWSIITICLHSLGALTAAITLAISMIISAEQSVIISSAIILAMYAIVVITYSFAAFARPGKFRKVVLYTSLPLLALIMGTLLTLSLMRIGPSLEDQNTRKALVSTVQSIGKFVEKEERIPTNAEGKNLVTRADISYAEKSDTQYTLCATFNTGSNNDGWYTAYDTRTMYPIYDSYTHESEFWNKEAGETCFTIESAFLTRDKEFVDSDSGL